MRIILANPRGFCAGVEMAIGSLELALRALGPPVYVFHEIVHNRLIVDSFRAEGAVFVGDLAQVPSGSTLVFSAHGVAPAVRQEARRRRLRTIDATCPLVAKVHLEAIRFAESGHTILLIGHEGHDEIMGTLGEAPGAMQLIQSLSDVEQLDFAPDERLAYLTQTTLSVDDVEQIVRRLHERFPQIVGPAKEDICFATQNRQEAVRKLAAESQLVLVVGSQNSSNSRRLQEIARRMGTHAKLIDGVDDLQDYWFRGVETVLLTAGASAPEEAVQQVVAELQRRFDGTVEHRTIREEQQSFPLPKELRDYAISGA